MVKKIFLSFGLLIGFQAFAQQGSASPYSFYGIGDTNFKGTNEYKSMGGNSVYADSIHLNLNNPAALGKLKATTLSVGATSKNYSFKSDDAKSSTNRFLVDYLAVGLPLTNRLGVVFGLKPYSNVGYKVNTTIANPDNNQKTNYINEGNGGLNNAFVGVGYQLSSKLYAGINAGYLFGNIEKKALIQLVDNGDGLSVAGATNELLRTDYSGYTVNFALQYITKIKSYDWQSNITYKPESKMSTDYLRKTQIINLISNTIQQTETSDLVSRKIYSPQELNIGTGFGKDLKWMVFGQFTYTENSKLNNSYDTPKFASYENSKRISVGGFYVPKYNSFTSYFDRVVYRAGLRYENTGLVLNSQSINDRAITAGFGFPIGRNFTNLNVGFEYGQRGSSKQSLFKENYFNINIGLSLNDFWFKRRKFE